MKKDFSLDVLQQNLNMRKRIVAIKLAHEEWKQQPRRAQDINR